MFLAAPPGKKKLPGYDGSIERTRQNLVDLVAESALSGHPRSLDNRMGGACGRIRHRENGGKEPLDTLSFGDKRTVDDLDLVSCRVPRQHSGDQMIVPPMRPSCPFSAATIVYTVRVPDTGDEDRNRIERWVEAVRHYPCTIRRFHAGMERAEGSLYVLADHRSWSLEKIRLRRHVELSLLRLQQELNLISERRNGLRQPTDRDRQRPPIG